MTSAEQLAIASVPLPQFDASYYSPYGLADSTLAPQARNFFLFQGTLHMTYIPLVDVGTYSQTVAFDPQVALPPASFGVATSTQSSSLMESGPVSPVIHAPRPIYPISFDAILAKCDSDLQGSSHASSQCCQALPIQSSCCAVHDSESISTRIGGEHDQLQGSSTRTGKPTSPVALPPTTTMHAMAMDICGTSGMTRPIAVDGHPLAPTIVAGLSTEQLPNHPMSMEQLTKQPRRGFQER
ncbi:hypothetical protein C8T65DRAFT_700345 [Cerioporus squamosus]|nr:hypothetical protein C8T65DRAFT_700345 [Cerioporus squamosus]